MIVESRPSEHLMTTRVLSTAPNTRMRKRKREGMSDDELRKWAEEFAGWAAKDVLRLLAEKQAHMDASAALVIENAQLKLELAAMAERVHAQSELLMWRAEVAGLTEDEISERHRKLAAMGLMDGAGLPPRKAEVPNEFVESVSVEPMRMVAADEPLPPINPDSSRPMRCYISKAVEGECGPGGHVLPLGGLTCVCGQMTTWRDPLTDRLCFGARENAEASIQPEEIEAYQKKLHDEMGKMKFTSLVWGR